MRKYDGLEEQLWGGAGGFNEKCIYIPTGRGDAEVMAIGI